MMSEYTALTSHLESLKAERKELDYVDIDALVEERVAEIKSEIRASIVTEVEKSKFVTDVKIEAVTDAINVVTRAIMEAQGVEVVESSELITDETY